MQFRNLFDDDRAVSPVIGVILMVAITVILAAVIGTFVLGLSDQVQDTTPRASFGFDVENSGEKVTITHESGDEIPLAQLSIKVDGEAPHSADVTDQFTDPVGAGDTYVIDDSDVTEDTLSSGKTVSVVWSSPNSDTTTTLSKHTL